MPRRVSYTDQRDQGPDHQGIEWVRLYVDGYTRSFEKTSTWKSQVRRLVNELAPQWKRATVSFYVGERVGQGIMQQSKTFDRRRRHHHEPVA